MSRARPGQGWFCFLKGGFGYLERGSSILASLELVGLTAARAKTGPAAAAIAPGPAVDPVAAGGAGTALPLHPATAAGLVPPAGASAAALGGVAVAAMLALVFAVGMVAVDTGNGVWIARLARRSDRASEAASRAMTLTVAVISLLVGAVVACSCIWISFDQWLNSHELTVSSLVVLAVLCAYTLGRSIPLAD